MRVFVLQKSSKYDVSAAKTHGDVIYLIDDYLPPFEPSTVCYRIREALSKYNFDASKDAIVLTGASIFVSLLMAVMAFDYETFNALFFNVKDSKYELVRVEL